MKITKILLAVLMIIPMGIVKICAEEEKPNGVIYCERYKSKHRMYYFGHGDIYDEGGDNLREENFRFYRCACGEVIFSNNRPESNNNIPGKYIETHIDMENLYDGYIVYSKSKIGTNLPMQIKDASMVSCNFYSGY
ncbi:hypothetical protein [Thomasclavelia saccharogumia]|uniref:hypothetical protein n=1 Tax=Thomasclavelia saccharogumia TaxID=341225 RepID=UPI00047ED0C9|nr:hypothetical protein [Thomasclavelia saccharogumia]